MATTIMTVKEALDAGITPGTLRGPTLHRPTSGVRVATRQPVLIDTCRAVARVVGPEVAFARTTALRLLGVDLPWPLEADASLHVVSSHRALRPKREGVVAHYCGQRRLDVVERFGLRLTSPAQSWLQVAHGLTVQDLVVLGDAVTRRKNPATTLSELRRLTDQTFKMRGLARARLALDLIRPGTDSVMETRLRLVLVDAGLPVPHVNEPALDTGGRFLSLPDLSYPALKIAIEYDGDVHRTDRATWQRDIARRARMEDAGWIVVTVTADQVLRDPSVLVARVRRAIGRRMSPAGR